MPHRRLRLVVPLLAAALGCQGGAPPAPADPPAEPPWFEDVTRARGLDFVHDAGPIGACISGSSQGRSTKELATRASRGRSG